MLQILQLFRIPPKKASAVINGSFMIYYSVHNICYGIIPETIPLHGPLLPLLVTQRPNAKKVLPLSVLSNSIAS